MNNQELNQIFNNLSKDDKTIFRLKVQKACRISYDIFYNWLTGRTEIPALAAKEIENILNELHNE